MRNTSELPEVGSQILDKIIESLTKQKNDLQLRYSKLEEQFRTKEIENSGLKKELTVMQ